MQSDSLKVMALIRAFMTYGHLEADLDPLQIEKVYKDISIAGDVFNPGQRNKMKELIDPSFYGFTEQDLDRTFYVDIHQMGGIISRQKTWVLRDLIQALQNAYCKHIGVEYMHIPHKDQCIWIRDKFELLQFSPPTAETRISTFNRLMWADEFSNFLAVKFNTAKRFGLEGCDTFIPGMKVAMDACVEGGAEKAVIGMPHRGRLNMLANVVRKPLEQLFAEFVGTVPIED